MTGTDNRKKNNMKQKRSDKKNKDQNSFGASAPLYFVLCFFIAAVAGQAHAPTYSRISMIYLPLLVIFCIWRTKISEPGRRKASVKDKGQYYQSVCARSR